MDFRNANACLRGWTTALRAADALHLVIASGRGATQVIPWPYRWVSQPK